LLVLVTGCGGGATATTSDAATSDGAGSNNDAVVGADAPGTPGCEAPANLGRGAAWVRANPMMISGISVAMGAPSAAAVDAYFDDFHATAVHTWENGLPSEIAGWRAANHSQFRYVSWVNVDGTSVANGDVLGGTDPLPGRIGYQIGDEPGDMDALDAIVAGAQAVKAADPDGLRIINLNDSDAANALRTPAAQHPEFDVLSYDHYSWGTGAHDGLASTRAAAIAAGKPYWRYAKSFYYKDDSPEGTESDLRWDAFVGAVYGFTGYTWFVYSIEAGSEDLAPLLFASGGDFGGTRTAQWTMAAGINAQLQRLGRTLAVLRSTDVRYVAKYVNVSGLDGWSAGAGGDPYLQDVSLGGSADALVGTFRDDCDEPYVMVQNQAHDGADFPNNSTSAKTFVLDFDFAGATDPSLDRSALASLDLSTGTVVDIPLTSTGASTASVELSLPAGGVVLFKYKTSHGFASQ
jgi:hypothetical protein